VRRAEKMGGNRDASCSASTLIAPRRAGWLTALACVLAGTVACLAALLEGQSDLR